MDIKTKEYIVYSASCGSYSDYEVCRLFKNEEKAEKYVEKKNKESYKNDKARGLIVEYLSFEEYIKSCPWGCWYTEEFEIED